ncbi:DNA-binding protein [Lysinibacillus sp. BW-2-10]|uniref:DNA-binding protein n=1 Tax=Lysinibacillus sp. BW-2-10 TaxID=2590030 RepID=UPI00117BE7C7|nr:DNA-binding protein [Lysinibacillus sp. BW-2-10]TSI08678.1 DNA-binding protein [Lysinibacillus sp. BW-2-10]
MDSDLFWLAVGIAIMGYFIGNGLKHMHHPKESSYDFFLIEEKELHTYVNLSKEAFQDLITKYPDAPKIELNGKTYYNYRQFINWMSSDDVFKK